MKISDLSGKVFGRLTALEPTSGRIDRAVIWKCKCSCGNLFWIASNKLTSGNTKSCGCLNLDHAKKEVGFSSKNRLFGRYKKNAKTKNREFTLSFDEFIEITSLNCFYCGEPPSSVVKEATKNFNGDYLYNGIDRIDNSFGYTRENVVPCCSKCNYAKRDMSFDDFYRWVRKVNEGLTVRDIRKALVGNNPAYVPLHEGN